MTKQNISKRNKIFQWNKLCGEQNTISSFSHCQKLVCHKLGVLVVHQSVAGLLRASFFLFISNEYTKNVPKINTIHCLNLLNFCQKIFRGEEKIDYLNIDTSVHTEILKRTRAHIFTDKYL